MADSKNVIVLVPNGHRQTVKVTPNTTMLQILEEVCQKHGFNANHYNLKHHNNVIDTNSIYRFTGLVNNAQLQMSIRSEARAVSNVTIGLQLENGTRATGEFTSDTTLLGVLLSLCPGQDPDKTALIYLHREVFGLEDLEKTTLQALGLNSGRAMLRLKTRSSGQANMQAHVAAPLAPKSSRFPGGNTKNSKKKHKANSSSGFLQNTLPDFMSMLKTEKAQTAEPAPVESKNKAEEKVEIAQKAEDLTNTSTVNEEFESLPSTSTGNNEVESKGQEGSSQEDEEKDSSNIEFLGDRNALIFNQANVKAIPRDELPENFYDLTIDDAKMLLRDAKRRREEIEEAPFLTKAQRELNKQKHKLEQLHKYRRAVIRIQFPDQLVLQGIFGPLEKVQAIKDFIKEYLSDPECDFTIYTAPPKHILNTEARLVDEDLVPSSIIHYSGSSGLKHDIREKLTVPENATSEALKNRRRTKGGGQTEKHSNESDVSRKNSGTMDKLTNMVPKWFSQSFKK